MILRALSRASILRALTSFGVLIATTVTLWAQVLTTVLGGDSLTGCATDWPVYAFNYTSRGDCSAPALQASNVYASPAGPALNVVNLAVSGTRLSTGTNNFASLVTPYFAPIVALKQFQGGPASGALGFDKVMMATLLPRADGTMDLRLLQVTACEAANRAGVARPPRAPSFDPMAQIAK